ncbi:hypothetical protein KPL70_001260 [Citrus sinensis]|uniref:uncharacterized protein LOC102625973 isoform X2 n=1 Tax=Citrus sinensis TaxID=2711 RepID=UPI0003D73F1D|nr:uncharacterized protein LOC102625973 isoform X2 [Citrus sinensis]KAH9763722.1 hypothetical protein KPL70_001260 [Citrus sinensis]
MEEKKLDYVLIPTGLLVMGVYHIWLLYTILRFPRRSVIGLNAESRHQWVHSIMTDPLKNGTLAVQTIRNNIMASTLLATTAITLSSLIGVFSIRYYAHVSFLVTLPTSKGNTNYIEYVARNLNRGSFFWSLGLRAFYLSFPLFLWIFGPIPMFVCCCTMSFLLYFLDTTSSFTRELHSHSFKEEAKLDDLESPVQSP